jgi:hypothetical protein
MGCRLMIDLPLNESTLDNYLAIASYVDSKMPRPNNNRVPSMFKILDIVPDAMDHNKFIKGRMKVIPSSKQLAIYEFIAGIMLKTTDYNRDLLYLRNFPYRKSFRDMKRFFADQSHETIRKNYNLALYDVCRLINKLDIQKII